MAKISEKGLLIFLAFVVFFLRGVFSKDLGDTYFIMTILGLVTYLADALFGKVEIPLEKTDTNRGQALLAAVIGYVILLAISTGILLGTKLFDVTSFVNILHAEILPFKGSELLKIISFGVIIPTIETIVFFGIVHEAMLEVGSEFFGKKLSAFTMSGPVITVILVTAVIFTVFHFQIRITENFPLMVTFLFGVISLIMIAQQKELKSAVLFHIINNLIVLLL